jgi:hypothetical protein
MNRNQFHFEFVGFDFFLTYFKSFFFQLIMRGRLSHVFGCGNPFDPANNRWYLPWFLLDQADDLSQVPAIASGNQYSISWIQGFTRPRGMECFFGVNKTKPVNRRIMGHSFEIRSWYNRRFICLHILGILEGSYILFRFF